MKKASKIKIAKDFEKAIDLFCQRHFYDPFRTHLGASEIGHPCSRYLWYKFRWTFAAEIDGRRQRLFDRGHREEVRFIQWLEGIGCTVYPVDPDTNEQWRITDCKGHFGGSLDTLGYLPEELEIAPGQFITLAQDYGIDIESPVLFEFKTNGTGASFNNLRSEGCQVQKEQHYIQQCIYGYKKELKLALYLNTNKNDDDIYAEFIELDWNIAQYNINKAEKIIFSPVAPDKISENPAFDKCKYCDAKEVCHYKGQSLVNCHSCKYAEPVDNAEWHCHKWNAIIPKDAIPTGCDSWESIA